PILFGQPVDQPPGFGIRPGGGEGRRRRTTLVPRLLHQLLVLLIRLGLVLLLLCRVFPLPGSVTQFRRRHLWTSPTRHPEGNVHPAVLFPLRQAEDVERELARDGIPRAVIRQGGRNRRKVPDRSLRAEPVAGDVLAVF